MFFRRNSQRRPNENDLIKDINTKSLEDVLLHPNLLTSIRNEIPSFLNYFFSEDGSSNSNFQKLVEYALSDIQPPNPNLKYNQILNNAASVLSFPSDEMRQRVLEDRNKILFKSLENFVVNPKVTQPLLAGHFQRIVENLMLFSPDKFFDEPFHTKLIDFLVRYIQISGYNELLIHILTDFSQHFKGNSICIVFEKILRKATFATYNIIINVSKQDDFMTLSRSQKNNLDRNNLTWMKDFQPLNLDKETIPFPHYVMSDLKNYTNKHLAEIAFEYSSKFFSRNEDNLGRSFSKSTKMSRFTPRTQSIASTMNSGFRKLEKNCYNTIVKSHSDNQNPMSKNYDFSEIYNFHEAKFIAYQCLSCIRKVYIENFKLIRFLQREDFVEMLLYCGVFSDVESPVSSEAFGLLFVIINGYSHNNEFFISNNGDNNSDDGSNSDDEFHETYSPNEIKYDIPPFDTESVEKLVHKYAEIFHFDVDNLTNQMVSAFLIFWNHRYEDTVADDGEIIYSDKYLPEPVVLPKTLTPFLILEPLIFSEPPVSDRLNIHYLNIIKLLIRKREFLTGKNLQKIEAYPEDVRRKIYQIDLLLFEFMTRDFTIYISPNQSRKMKFPNALKLIFPCVPDETTSRSPLCGTPREIFLLVSKTQIFGWKDHVSRMSVLIDDVYQQIDNNGEFMVKLNYYKNRMPILKENDLIHSNMKPGDTREAVSIEEYNQKLRDEAKAIQSID
ncbi:hypothetical protein TRFO_34990 [Tritrichomonas foetus]|uniref:Uncharacterized protein n=1 Tax=Tritrichomonas foetus TaxID=1144522 RepID=A0A1J4JJ49_9EUKA|nr:hypothetical protein TRFO_34990 [Tritrichomonas foetus]|eukprot:OHS98617.1 hypothetical protein TRFO_34990 [Tritrichomonas foetus]